MSPYFRRQAIQRPTGLETIRMNRKAFIVLVGSMFISMMGMGLVTPFLPIYANTMGASGMEVGLIQAAFSITGIGTLLFVGRLSDRYGRKSFLSGGLTILAIASFGLLYATRPFISSSGVFFRDSALRRTCLLPRHTLETLHPPAVRESGLILPTP